MVLVFAVAAGVFLSIGLGVTTSTMNDGECKNPQTVVPLGNRRLIISGQTENCTCTLREGKLGRHPNGTMCTELKDGRLIRGSCSEGACKETESTFGCKGKNGTEVGSTIKDGLCFFECKNEDGKTEWAFLQDGFPCVNRDDGDGHPKNGTCKHRRHRDRADQNETVCFPNDQLHLVGC
uniref:Putative secreted protein n=1 Tax=Amblyomma cajennense TaxID=34607 RepID=A0A023FQF7_AMBCJ